MTRRDLYKRIDDIDSDPAFHAYSGEGGDVRDLAKLLPGSAVAELQPADVISYPDEGAISLTWHVGRGLTIRSHGYGGFSVTSESELPKDLPWFGGKLGSLFAADGYVRDLLDGLFGWVLGGNSGEVLK